MYLHYTPKQGPEFEVCFAPNDGGEYGQPLPREMVIDERVPGNLVQKHEALQGMMQAPIPLRFDFDLMPNAPQEFALLLRRMFKEGLVLRDPKSSKAVHGTQFLFTDDGVTCYIRWRSKISDERRNSSMSQKVDARQQFFQGNHFSKMLML